LNRPPRFALHHPIANGLAIISGAELHHLRDVMRLRVGDVVTLFNDDNIEHLARIERFEDDRAILRIEKTEAAREVTPLILATAIIKGPRMDFVVEKAAELGVTELWPMLCERGVATTPGAERLARWRRLAVAAAKQSLASAALKLREPTPLVHLIETLARDTLAGRESLKLICTEGAEPIASVIRRVRPRAIVIACGPEGDFTDNEMELATRASFVRVGLGRNRLRSETAAIAAVSVASALLDEIGEGDG
jgi:16S rRNA (uracil1498-N3)-methyltransferase